MSVSATSPEMNVDSADVIRVILQHLREMGFNKSADLLSKETKTTLNTVGNLQTFIADVTSGRWASVLRQAANITLPRTTQVALYEHICFELIELGEIETARAMLRTTETLIELQRADPTRFLRMNRMLTQGFDAVEAYTGSTRDKQRKKIAEELSTEVQVVAPSRLLALLQQSLKWQRSKGLLPAGNKFDIFLGSAPIKRKEPESFPKKRLGQIKFGKASHPECCAFTLDGQALVTGSVDVWDFKTCKHKRELKYQLEDDFMMHAETVLCIAFSHDSEMLATGSKEGMLKVWRLSSGKCLRRIPKAHGEGVTDVSFSRGGNQLATSSFDSTARIHGLKSGRVLNEFRGHQSFVNAVIYADGDEKLVTSSTDATVRIWNTRTAECTCVFRPPLYKPGMQQCGYTNHKPSNNSTETDRCSELPVQSVMRIPLEQHLFLVCNNSPQLFVVNLKGQLVKSFISDKPFEENAIFIACSTSRPEGKFVYGLTKSGIIYCFDYRSGELSHTLDTIAEGSTGKRKRDNNKVKDKGQVLGIAQHPHRNVMATYTKSGYLQLWKS